MRERRGYTPPTPEEREAKSAETFQKMQQGVEQLLADPKGYFDAMSRFHHYSWGNIAMIRASVRTQPTSPASRRGTVSGGS